MPSLPRPGLVSVSFRQLTPEEIIALCPTAGVRCLEWGGDIHVPHGNLPRAREIGQQTREAGLIVTAYGSYLRLGSTEGPCPEEIVETAAALGAPTIRVWAGPKGSADCTEAERDGIVQAALQTADLAAHAGLTLAYEFHGGTLTDELTSAARLLSQTKHPAIRCLWQPPNGASLDDCLATLEITLPFLAHVHVFHWWPTSADRKLLRAGRDRWIPYLQRIHQAALTPDFLLEFLPDNNPDLLAGEVAALQTWIDEIWPQTPPPTHA